MVVRAELVPVPVPLLEPKQEENEEEGWEDSDVSLMPGWGWAMMVDAAGINISKSRGES